MLKGEEELTWSESAAGGKKVTSLVCQPVVIVTSPEK